MYPLQCSPGTYFLAMTDLKGKDDFDGICIQKVTVDKMLLNIQQGAQNDCAISLA